MSPKKLPSIEAIGASIRARREASQLTQAQAGEALEVSLQQYAKYESGKNRITADALPKLAKLFGCKPGDFYE